MCRRICALLMALLLAAPLQCFAAGDEGSLTIEYAFGSARFDLYLVATIDDGGNVTLAEDFASYPVSLDTDDTDDARDLALTLQGYVLRDGLAPLQTKRTNDWGRLCFENLPMGLYLILGKIQVEGQTVLLPQPVMASLPQMSGEVLHYHITVLPKHESYEGERDYPIEVFKVWDDGSSKDRPISVAIDLLCDGRVYDTVVLSSKNNWRYKWTQLPSEHEWVIVEREREGYTVSVTREGNAFVVTNHKLAPPVKPPELSQTGMLWWPVPLLGLAGMLLFLLGWHRRREDIVSE